MNRKLLVTLHLYLAAFFTPMVLLVSITGGLYLYGIKGSSTSTQVAVLAEQTLKVPKEAQAAHDYVTELLQAAGIEHRFAYVRAQGPAATTRPTHRTHYQFRQGATGIEVNKVEPNLMMSALELHKGHGPQWFRSFETVFALGLVLVMLTGFWLGLQSAMLRSRTLVLTAVGTAVTLLLALVL